MQFDETLAAVDFIARRYPEHVREADESKERSSSWRGVR
jgi:hypothetical protein|tara:strand:- start:172 stop:288 length:117 start_codon:yes stop_codon:yes gene_type:complete